MDNLRRVLSEFLQMQIDAFHLYNEEQLALIQTDMRRFSRAIGQISEELQEFDYYIRTSPEVKIFIIIVLIVDIWII